MSNGTIQLPADGAGKRLATQTATRDAQTIHREEDISIDFLRAVDLGLVEGYEIFRRFGRNPSITTSTDPEDIWETGGTLVYPSSAASVSLVSSATTDTNGGAGANTVTIWYLNSSYVMVTETLTMAGQTPVTSSQTAIRFIRGLVATAGATGAPDGTLTFSIGGNTQGTIGAGVLNGNQTQLTHYTVPDNFQAHLVSYLFTQNGGSSNSLVAIAARPTGGVFNTKNFAGLESSGSTAVGEESVMGSVFPARTDIKGVGVSVTSTVAISLRYELLLEPV